MSEDAAITLLDGPTGTELARRGHSTELPLWSALPLAEAPEAVRAVHRDYLDAGAQVLTTCTFRTHARSLAVAGWQERSDELNRTAVRVAREAIAETARPARIAGSIAPLEDCFSPDRVPPAAELEAEHRRHAASLAAAGVDLLLVETMATRREAEAATRAARATGLEVWTSLLGRGDGEHLYDGTSLADAALAVLELGVAAVLVNCVPAVDIAADAGALAAVTSDPVGAYGNVGHASGVDGWSVEHELTPAAFARHMLACADAGATILGGCCGTTPAHIAALAAALR